MELLLSIPAHLQWTAEQRVACINARGHKLRVFAFEYAPFAAGTDIDGYIPFLPCILVYGLFTSADLYELGELFCIFGWVENTIYRYCTPGYKLIHSISTPCDFRYRITPFSCLSAINLCIFPALGFNRPDMKPVRLSPIARIHNTRHSVTDDRWEASEVNLNRSNPNLLRRTAQHLVYGEDYPV
jgi:hypothetical protein